VAVAVAVGRAAAAVPEAPRADAVPTRVPWPPAKGTSQVMQ